VPPEATHFSVRRYFAHLVDSIVFTVLLVVVAALAFAAGGDVAGYAVVVLGFTVGQVAFYVIAHGRSGRTPGKRLFGLRVIGADGLRPQRDALIRRSLPLIFEYFQLVALFAMMSSDHRQRMGDRGAHTYVIRSTWATPTADVA
jgi:uncharacterized RDD family membrane protein YckC